MNMAARRCLRRSRDKHRTRIGIFTVFTTLSVCAAVHAQPIAVRFTEGTMHGFLVLRSGNDETIAQGELLQVAHRDRVDSRFVLNFNDGSLYDEKVSFSQRRVFTMLSYQLIQRGPSFPDTLDASMNRKTGEYRVRAQSGTDGPEELIAGRLELPPDVYNGMIVTVLRNLTRGESENVQFVAFMPKPKLIQLELLPVADEPVVVGDQSKYATQYVLKPQVGSLVHFFGSLLGKLPSDFRYHFWIFSEGVPAFVRFDGPLYLNGPVWRLELLSPRLSEKPDSKILLQK